ncbi:hypothetical protein BDK51DRAFT_46545 [Blyttiomyces helicus]|uniref:Uncharacterized protein n=1 Tax=Blyttiomyces helicus TaxID=388810 RepID=A0A4P9WLM9_9FUNG|nr:hypothetical protein BDK51DRAFT_46545 [Blyttiomyces helicus]|eukprot:RKO93784.1 hypothetical protein BDK51DRAFT_46545 [Blyttiomyces helicus]
MFLAAIKQVLALFTGTVPPPVQPSYPRCDPDDDASKQRPSNALRARRPRRARTRLSNSGWVPPSPTRLSSEIVRLERSSTTLEDRVKFLARWRGADRPSVRGGSPRTSRRPSIPDVPTQACAITEKILAGALQGGHGLDDRGWVDAKWTSDADAGLGGQSEEDREPLRRKSKIFRRLSSLSDWAGTTLRLLAPRRSLNETRETLGRRDSIVVTATSRDRPTPSYQQVLMRAAAQSNPTEPPARPPARWSRVSLLFRRRSRDATASERPLPTAPPDLPCAADLANYLGCSEGLAEVYGAVMWGDNGFDELKGRIVLSRKARAVIDPGWQEAADWKPEV